MAIMYLILCMYFIAYMPYDMERFPPKIAGFFCKLAVYIGYSLFLSVRSERWEVSLHPLLFILFRAAEKERTKISREPKSLISCESLRHSKRRPPETPIPLRMSVIAKWAKLASLKQNAHF